MTEKEIEAIIIKALKEKDDILSITFHRSSYNQLSCEKDGILQMWDLLTNNKPLVY